MSFFKVIGSGLRQRYHCNTSSKLTVIHKCAAEGVSRLNVNNLNYATSVESTRRFIRHCCNSDEQPIWYLLLRSCEKRDSFAEVNLTRGLKIWGGRNSGCWLPWRLEGHGKVPVQEAVEVFSFTCTNQALWKFTKNVALRVGLYASECWYVNEHCVCIKCAACSSSPSVPNSVETGKHFRQRGVFFE